MSVSYFKTSSQSAFTGVAVTVGPIEWIAAFPGSTAKVLFRQKFQQDIDSWTALTLSTPHGVATTYLLVKEDDFSAIGGGQQTWSRYYACTPPQRVEYTSYAAQFPGLTNRDPIAATTQAKITYDYFLVGTLPTLAQESRVTITGTYDQPLLGGNVYLTSSTNPLFSSTNPSATAYIASITADAATSSSFSITAEPQTLSRWEGDFYERRTINIKAK